MFSEKKYFILLLIIPLLGGFLRFYRLGALPIDGDNAFHFISAKAILKTGVPLLPSGDLYLRSLPLMYMEALSLKVFGVNEWGLGIPNALVGTINILLVYFLVITIWRDKSTAIITALFFSISPWAIAIARMPRMYELLLMTVLLIWIFFYKWYYLNERGFVIPLIISSVLAISLHRAAIIPLTCLILPLLLERKLTGNCIVSVTAFIALFLFWINYPNILNIIF